MDSFDKDLSLTATNLFQKDDALIKEMEEGFKPSVPTLESKFTPDLTMPGLRPRLST